MKLISAALPLVLLCGCNDNDRNLAGGSDAIEWMASNTMATAETWNGVDRLTCRPKVLDVCGPNECEPAPPKTYVVWEPATDTYQRCDETGCDTYQATSSPSGYFTNVTIAGTGTLLKVGANGAFTEVATLMDATLVYRGTCVW